MKTDIEGFDDLQSQDDYLFDATPIIQDISASFDANLGDLSVQDADDILNEIENASNYAPNYYYQRRIAQDNDTRSP
jgi:hypothetical protein